MKEFELKDKNVVLYELSNKDYGIILFNIEPIFKRHKLVECRITVLQRTTQRTYIIKNLYQNTLYFGGYPQPQISKIGWCHEHKTQFITVYPPQETDSFRIEFLSSFDIIFEKHEKGLGKVVDTII